MRIAVLGAGLAGLTTAWCLMRDGHEVTLIERNREVAGEASGANGGIISASRAFPWANPQMLKTFMRALTSNDQAVRVRVARWDPAFWSWGMRFVGFCSATRHAELLERKVRFVRYAQAQFGEITAQSGVVFDRRRGVMYLYRDAAGLEAGDKKMEPMRKFGFAIRTVDTAEARRIDPGLAQAPIAGAVYSESDESGDSGQFCRSLAEDMQKRGAQLHLGCEVRGLRTEGDRLTGVEVSGLEGASDKGAGEKGTSEIKADAFVCALGIIDPALSKTLGADLPIYPVRGFSATLPIVNPAAAPRVAGMDESKLAAYCPMGNNLRLTGGAEFAGWGREAQPEDFKRLHRLAEELFPGATDASSGRSFVCRRPMTPQSTPLLGKGRYANLWFNVGLGHMGWTMSFGSARITADLIAGREAGIPLEGLLIKAT